MARTSSWKLKKLNRKVSLVETVEMVHNHMENMMDIVDKVGMVDIGGLIDLE